ncbi:hypothetical protein [Myxosarcina sp. GI1]|uniref:hypothetical protein n=1 Tax=Myxosarcina sp. GI1 TaxID=1541065 RepID=UPI00056D7C9F|nr:hypothetical protein [Myxosarcina sp. GI1]
MSEQTPVTAQELSDIITEFEQYRERLITETLEAAKKAKLSQKHAREKLEPQIATLDAKLEQLRQQKDNMTASN